MKTTEYIILTLANYSDSQLTDINNVCLTSTSLARKNNDKTKCIMKVESDSTGSYPSIISSLTKYSLSEIKSIMQTTEWIQVVATGDLPADWPGHSLKIE